MPPQKPPEKVDFSKHVNSLWCIYLVSFISACNGELVTYPLDLIKTRLQVQGEKAGKLGQSPHRGMTTTAIGIITEEGFFRLWKGIRAAFLRHFLYSGIRICAYREMKNWMLQMNADKTYFPLWQSAVCGATAGAIGQYAASPADLLKVQMQMEGKRRLLGLPPRILGMWDAYRKIYAAGGIPALWKGSVPNVQRAALVTLGDISAYDLSKRYILRHSNLIDNYVTHILASFCAGFVAAGMSTPADVIKTRVMNQPLDEKGRGTLYRSTWDCYVKTVSQEGVGALYKGFFPVWLRLAPWALVFWNSYEQIMRLLGAQSF